MTTVRSRDFPHRWTQPHTNHGDRRLWSDTAVAACSLRQQGLRHGHNHNHNYNYNYNEPHDQHVGHNNNDRKADDDHGTAAPAG